MTQRFTTGRRRIWAVAVAALTITATAALAQQRPAPGGPGGPDGAVGPFGQMFRGIMAAYLELTDSQKEQAGKILDAAREKSKPIVEELAKTQQAIHDAVHAGKPQIELERLAESTGALHSKLAVIRVDTAVKLYALLTPQQKEKLEKLRATVRPMFGGWRGKPSGPPAEK